MGLTDGSKYFNAPSYTAAQWTARNPILLTGEVGWELHPTTGIPWRAKIGPGHWNDLPYQEDLFNLSTPPTNIIGDARGDLQYKSLREIMELMFYPFDIPDLSVPLINVNSLGYAASRTLEIGTTISSPVLMNATVDNPGGVTNYNITAGGFFTNEGNFGSLPASLTLAPVTPAVVTEVTLSLKAAFSGGPGGFSNIVTSLLAVYPKLIWGESNATSLAPGDWAGITDRQTLITKSYKNDYTFNQTGYLYLAIPSMLSPSGLVFTDLTNPDDPGPITFQDQGVQSINNGVGTYNYNTYRSVYSMIYNPTVVRVR